MGAHAHNCSSEHYHYKRLRYGGTLLPWDGVAPTHRIKL